MTRPGPTIRYRLGRLVGYYAPHAALVTVAGIVGLLYWRTA